MVLYRVIPAAINAPPNFALFKAFLKSDGLKSIKPFFSNVPHRPKEVHGAKARSDKQVPVFQTTPINCFLPCRNPPSLVTIHSTRREKIMPIKKRGPDGVKKLLIDYEDIDFGIVIELLGESFGCQAVPTFRTSNDRYVFLLKRQIGRKMLVHFMIRRRIGLEEERKP